MRLPWTLIVALLAHHPVLGLTPAKRSYLTHNYYVLEHDPLASPGTSLADIARALGVEVVEPAGELLHHWLVRIIKPDLAIRSDDADPVIDVFKNLWDRASGDEVRISSRSQDTHHARAIVSSVKYLARQTPRQRVKRAPPPLRPPQEESPETPAQKVATRLGIQDPMFPDQWHLVNNDNPEHMMNVTPVWEMGFTGKGVISSLVDDGLDYTSEDLKDNFVRSILCLRETSLTSVLG
jgi:kexin